MAARKISNSTQKFIEISDIIDDIVLLGNGNACLVVEVGATNFDLLSPEEQDAKIYSYAALLNSLSFSIQILIRSKRLNISSYLKLLEEDRLNAKNPIFAKEISMYKDFIANLVKVNSILDKKFYIVIYYNSLEQGVVGAKEQSGVTASQSLFLVGAKASLHSKAESLLNQLGRLNLRADVLEKERLVKLYYELFNDANLEMDEMANYTIPDNMKGEEI